MLGVNFIIWGKTRKLKISSPNKSDPYPPLQFLHSSWKFLPHKKFSTGPQILQPPNCSNSIKVLYLSVNLLHILIAIFSTYQFFVAQPINYRCSTNNQKRSPPPNKLLHLSVKKALPLLVIVVPPRSKSTPISNKVLVAFKNFVTDVIIWKQQ